MISRLCIFLTVVLVSTGLLSVGCVSFDAPNDLVGKAVEIHAVVIYSVRPPYRITSLSQLKATSSTKLGGISSSNTQAHSTQRISSASYQDWYWSVWASPNVVGAWRKWQNSAAANACATRVISPCLPLDWNLALKDLYRADAYLLNRPPLPVTLRINLIVQGTAFRTSVYRKSPRAVPLEFTFWFPVSMALNSSSESQREDALIHAVTTVGYELQHVEFAAHKTSGPAAPEAQRLFKDEANSACWRLASRLVIMAGRRGGNFMLEPITDKDLTIYGAEFGTEVNVQNAALWGPVLLRHDLVEYLHQITPSSDPAQPLQVTVTNYALMNHILAYCRGFTRYGGDIAKQPMPVTDVARTLFWTQGVTQSESNPQ